MKLQTFNSSRLTRGEGGLMSKHVLLNFTTASFCTSALSITWDKACKALGTRVDTSWALGRVSRDYWLVWFNFVFTSLSAPWWPFWRAVECPRNRKIPNAREMQGSGLPETELISAQRKMIVFFFFTMICQWLPYSLHRRGAIPPLSRSNSVPSNEGHLVVNLPYSHFPLYYVKNNELLIIICVRKKIQSKCGCPWLELC